MRLMKRHRLTAAIALVLGVSPLFAADDFTVSDIRVEGLQRISAGTVFASMPINVGDRVDREVVGNTIRSLFGTGNFDDIKLSREGNILVVSVQKRASISEIKIDGNNAIKTDALLDSLKKQRLAEGQVFKR